MLQEVKNVVDNWEMFSEMEETKTFIKPEKEEKKQTTSSDAEVRLFAEMLASM